MNDLNENFSGKEQGQAQRREGDQFAPSAKAVLSTSAAPSSDGGTAEAMENAGPCQNGVCSLTWKPLRPAA